jgi:hypothetical protein
LEVGLDERSHGSALAEDGAAVHGDDAAGDDVWGDVAPDVATAGVADAAGW